MNDVLHKDLFGAIADIKEYAAELTTTTDRARVQVLADQILERVADAMAALELGRTTPPRREDT